MPFQKQHHFTAVCSLAGTAAEVSRKLTEVDMVFSLGADDGAELRQLDDVIKDTVLSALWTRRMRRHLQQHLHPSSNSS